MSATDSIISSIKENKIKKNNISDIDIKINSDTSVDNNKNNDDVKPINTLQNRVINSTTNGNNKDKNNDIKSYIPSWLTLAFYINLFTNYKFIILILVIITLISLLLSFYFYDLDIEKYTLDLINAINEYGHAISIFLYELFKPLVEYFYLIFYGVESTGKNVEKSVKSIVDSSNEKDDNKDQENNSSNINIDEKLKNDINTTIQKNEVILPDHTNGNIQTNTGWCFIGADENVRKCVQMNGNICMSNQTFKTKNKCVSNNK